MGMTIDTAITVLGMVEAHGICIEAKDIAVETMRKYQKIRQIAFPLQFCSTDKLEHEAIMKICEVIEDGKNDK